jgi:hypothetical protein
MNHIRAVVVEVEADMLVSVGRFIGRVFCSIVILSLLSAAMAPAAVIRVEWSPCSAPDLAGYKIHFGDDGVQFPNQLIVPDPDAVSRTIGGLTVGNTYYFVIQSFDSSANMSSFSNVASCEALPWNSEAVPPEVPVIVGLGQPVFPFSWDVTNFDGVSGAGLEVSRVNETFANPNGTAWDPGHSCFTRILSSASGNSTMDAGNFEGPGIYQVRVVALDSFGTIICRFSDSAYLEVIAGTPGLPELILTGPGPGPDNPPLVRVFDPLSDQAGPLLDFLAYGVERYGVNVCAGDVTGDGVPEIITGPGPGEQFGPQVRVFDDTGATLHADFFAYGTMRWGVTCSVGDIDGDLVDEIITAPGPGEVFGPHVRGWGRDGSGQFQAIPGVSFMAYGTMSYGANAVCGDIDGDGIDEIITGAGPGAVFGPHVRAFDYDGAAVSAMPQVSFMAYGTEQYGVNVSCGDIDGDGFDEIVTGPGPGAMFGPHVRAFDYDGVLLEPLAGASFFAYNEIDAFGVNVSCGDIDGDGIDEIVTAPGPGPGPEFTSRIYGWNYYGGLVSRIDGLDILAYDEEQTFGARVTVCRGVN